MVRAKVLNRLKWSAILLAVAALTFFAIRIYDVQRGPSLEVWHTYVPRELGAEAIDGTDWKGYLTNEAGIFEELRLEVSGKLSSDERVPISHVISRAAPSIRRTFPRTSIARSCSNRTAFLAARSCCCTA